MKLTTAVKNKKFTFKQVDIDQIQEEDDEENQQQRVFSIESIILSKSLKSQNEVEVF